MPDATPIIFIYRFTEQRHQLKPRRVQNPVPAEAMGGVWWHHRNDIAAMSAS